MLVWPKEEFKINNNDKRQIADKRKKEELYKIHIGKIILERLVTLKEKVKILLELR